MSVPLKLTQEQYDRWVQFQKESKICKPSTSSKFLTPEKEQKMIQVWKQTNGNISATCRATKSCNNTVRKVLKQRGLIQ